MPANTTNPAPASPEEIVWQGGPSQVTNLVRFLIDLVIAAVLLAIPFVFRSAPGWVAALAVVPLAVAGFHWLRVRSLRFTLTTERLRIETGILTRRTDDMELYRVKDFTLTKPIALRLFGLGDITINTSDHTTPRVTLHAVSNPSHVHDLIRANVERQRDRKRVREVDFAPEST
ncbi:MAG: PH domain-containing protein [Planctomycetes bacterium]|nr:PH domain-containing protein [Planctomycetota bacterium]